MRVAPVEIKSTKGTNPYQRRATEDERPGVLIGVNQPGPALSRMAQSTLGLAQPPNQLVLAVPPQQVGNVFAGAPKDYAAMDKAIVQTQLNALKFATKALANTPGAPNWFNYGVKVFWLGVGVAKLYNQWRDPSRDVPVLMVKSVKAGWNAASLAANMTGLAPQVFDNDVLDDQLGAIFTGATAAAEGKDIGFALMNDHVLATQAGRALNVVSPLLEAALNDPNTAETITFGPLPSVEYPELADDGAAVQRWRPDVADSADAEL